MTNEFTDKHEFENIYNEIRESIKEKIEAKGISCKGKAKSVAITEIMTIFSDELGLDIANEVINGRNLIHDYYSKYKDVKDLERQYTENEKKLKEQESIIKSVFSITDETLKNAVTAYEAVNTIGKNNDARDIAITYINSKGREDLKNNFAKNNITLETCVPMSAIKKFKERVMNLKGDNFANDYYIKILDECIAESKSNL